MEYRLMKIAIFGKPRNGQQFDYLQELFNLLEEKGIPLVFYKPYFEFIKEKLNFSKEPELFSNHSELRDKADILFSIGGDGTLLDTITLVRDSGIPILGINLGRLGFISSVSKNEVKKAVEDIISKKYILDQRTLLQLDTEEDLYGDLNFALNDITVHKRETPALIVIHVWINNQFLNSYWADGLIISTPTGSTGYSLSCNGPILTPATRNVIITPIATHNLTVRPIVIPDDCKIKITVGGRNKDFLVGLDSRYQYFKAGLELNIRRADFTINLMHLENKDFFSTIREKLKWGLDARN